MGGALHAWDFHNDFLFKLEINRKTNRNAWAAAETAKNVSAERPANWAWLICQWPFRLISNLNFVFTCGEASRSMDHD